MIIFMSIMVYLQALLMFTKVAFVEVNFLERILDQLLETLDWHL